MASVVVGFGGNIGDDAAIVERFRRAREAFEVIGSVRSAALYRSAPIGPDQAPFLNTAVTWQFDGEPAALISTVLEIERLLGRERQGEARWGPRVIDLDVLVWGDRVIHIPGLDVPHPRLVERRFALLPLIDLVGGEVSVVGERLDVHARRVVAQAVEQLSETW